jgi:anti-sigma factor RsiW
MTRMDCSEVRELIAAHLDGELPAAERSAVDQHVEGCPQCAGARAGLAALRQRVRAVGSFEMPGELEVRARALIAEASAETGARPWRRLALLAASHVAVAVAGAALALVLAWRHDGEQVRSREIMTAHVRALLADQLVQVASADTHTVRPWFVGRVPFAPEVRDLAGRNFALVGGRVDFILERPAAALVYSRRKHRINVFVLPSEHVPPGADLATTRQGYNILSWHQGAFAFFAISDLNAAELKELADALAAPPG